MFNIPFWKKNVFLFAFILILPFTSSAQVPGQMNFQGQLMGSQGEKVVDNNYTMTFSLYDTVTGPVPLWTESQTVWVGDGIYNVVLGQPGNELSAGLFDNQIYLGVTVGADEEMQPRQVLTSTAFAMRSAMAEKVEQGVIETVHLADDAVTTDKVADQAITAVKIDGGSGSGLDADRLDGLEASSFALSGHNHDASYHSKAHVDALESRIASLEAKLQYLTVVTGVVNGMIGPHVMVTGANLHVRNGSGSTTTVNGTGNLIVGYNEPRGSGDDRSGSHHIVTGKANNFSYYGGLVAGLQNTISAPYATVTGGSYNSALGGGCSVSGGQNNQAGAMGVGYCSVSGGANNKALGGGSSISGGNGNEATGNQASISGGVLNKATEMYASVGGGWGNTAGGQAACISGGRYNKASGDYSYVGGGGGPDSTTGNEAFSHYSAVLGGQLNMAGDNSNPSDHTSGQFAAVSGGFHNTASGIVSSISGGYTNMAGGNYSSISGGIRNTASGSISSISGGDDNTSAGQYSSISGGRYNKARGKYSFIGGGGHPTNPDRGNTAYADYSAILGGADNETGDSSAGETARASCISGGYSNATSENYASINGGVDNLASGLFSSVSGGVRNTASGESSSISAGAENNATALESSVSGGWGNTASGKSSAISAGAGNQATETNASVCGGHSNTAGGPNSTVSGGYNRSVSSNYNWRAGSLLESN